MYVCMCVFRNTKSFSHQSITTKVQKQRARNGKWGEGNVKAEKNIVHIYIQNITKSKLDWKTTTTAVAVMAVTAAADNMYT